MITSSRQKSNPLLLRCSIGAPPAPLIKPQEKVSKLLPPTSANSSQAQLSEEAVFHSQSELIIVVPEALEAPPFHHAHVCLRVTDFCDTDKKPGRRKPHRPRLRVTERESLNDCRRKSLCFFIDLIITENITYPPEHWELFCPSHAFPEGVVVPKRGFSDGDTSSVTAVHRDRLRAMRSHSGSVASPHGS